mgnify:CR=1 FL=1
MRSSDQFPSDWAYFISGRIQREIQMNLGAPQVVYRSQTYYFEAKILIC